MDLALLQAAKQQLQAALANLAAGDEQKAALSIQRAVHLKRTPLSARVARYIAIRKDADRLTPTMPAATDSAVLRWRCRSGAPAAIRRQITVWTADRRGDGAPTGADRLWSAMA